MKLTSPFTSRHVGVAAEAFAAALFARCGLDISVQYGANQPEYDLVVAQGERMLKVSVKGSKDGGWGLTQNYVGNAGYQGAVDVWLSRHKPRTIFCLVQFKGVAEDSMPRIYLASPLDIAERLRASAAGRGDTILHERQVWGPRAFAHGSTDEIPQSWRFSAERVEQLLTTCA